MVLMSLTALSITPAMTSYRAGCVSTMDATSNFAFDYISATFAHTLSSWWEKRREAHLPASPNLDGFAALRHCVHLVSPLALHSRYTWKGDKKVYKFS